MQTCYVHPKTKSSTIRTCMRLVLEPELLTYYMMYEVTREDREICLM